MGHPSPADLKSRDRGAPGEHGTTWDPDADYAVFGPRGWVDDGVYSVELSRDEVEMALDIQEEECRIRAAFLDGVWERADREDEG